MPLERHQSRTLLAQVFRYVATVFEFEELWPLAPISWFLRFCLHLRQLCLSLSQDSPKHTTCAFLSLATSRSLANHLVFGPISSLAVV
jgi:hypothetical protein